MAKNEHENTTLLNTRFLFESHYRQMLLLALVIGSIVFGSVFLTALTYKRYQEILEDALNTVLDTSNQASETWIRNHAQIVSRYAQSNLILVTVESLLELIPSSNELLASPAQTLLRQQFLTDITSGRYIDFFIIGAGNINLASSQDSNIGKINSLIEQAAIQDNLWDGKVQISRLHVSSLHSTEQREGKNYDYRRASTFVGAPIKNQTGKVIALLILHVEAEASLSQLLKQGRLGNTGETYAFDDKGWIITKSRFEETLHRIGLLEKGKSSALNIRLIDPGIDLSKSSNSSPISDDSPLTRMASSAIGGQRSFYLEGYRDYRGVPVVGAWAWNSELGIGIATEQDFAEAYEMHFFVRKLIYSASFSFCLILVALTYVFKRGRRQLRAVRLRLEAIVETAADSIMVVDNNGVIESANPMTEKLFHYAKSDLIGKNISSLLPRSHNSEDNTYPGSDLRSDDLRSDSVGNATKVQEFEGQRKDGSHFPIDLSINQLNLESDWLFACIIRDKTSQKESEAITISAREEAEAANRAKSQFLATMSHEIRTPLNGIVGTIDLLNYTRLEENQQDMINTARNSASILQGIIDDVLDFSKIEAGRLDLEQISLSLETLIEEAGQALSVLAWDKGVELLIFTDPALPEIIGDPVRLKQIIFNLAGNAIKFSIDLQQRRGQVIVSAVMPEQKDGRVKVRLIIRDNGIGMSAEVQKQLFQPFTQGEEETTRRFGGTGLGLVITSRLVELMDGRIMVQSVEGEGSTFTVELTLPSSTEVCLLAQPLILQGIQVLLVQPNREAAIILSHYLDNAGAEVTLVNIEEAMGQFTRLYNDSTNLVIVIDSQGDTNLSNSLFEELRRESKGEQLQLVVIERGRRHQARLSQDGCISYDLNAVPRSTVLNAVASAAGRDSPNNQWQPGSSTPTVTLTPEEARSAGQLILLVDDNATNRKVISQQLNMLGYAVDTADDGKQGLSMWQNGGYLLLLTDCHMPEMDGYDLARNVRSEEKGNTRIPIIAITADALKGTAKNCLAAGMDGYLTKPMQLSQLREALDKWLPTKKSQPDSIDRKEASQVEAEIVESPELQEPVDPKALGELLGIEDTVMLKDFYNDFLQTGLLICNDLKEAYASQDLATVSEHAHKLKSSARTVGANMLADCCLALEEAGKADDHPLADNHMSNFSTLFQQVQTWIENYPNAPR